MINNEMNNIIFTFKKWNNTMSDNVEIAIKKMERFMRLAEWILK